MGSNEDLTKYYRNLRVAISKGEPSYSNLAPFSPHSSYPEHIFQSDIGSDPNPAYEAVRNCFQLLGMDETNFGSPEWNPLQEVINPGERVVIKPNFVLSSHYEGGNLFSIITHPSVIRTVVDYVYKALKGEGEITIADAPQMDCNFGELLEKTHLTSIQDFYWSKRSFEIKILDLRDFWLDQGPGEIGAFVERRKKLPGDPQGSTVVNLARRSGFYGVKNCNKFYGADYDRNETIRHHVGETQEYMVSRTILGADVLISVPKLKVHKKVGVTLNAKGLVGINTNKNYIVHYTLGTPDEGGDQFPSNILTSKERLLIKTQRLLYDLLLTKKNPTLDAVYATTVRCYRKFGKRSIGTVGKNKKMLDAGNWHGNDSSWRMVSDLMKIILYADKNGTLKDAPQRKMFSVVDGIIGGERNGPLVPDENKAGVVMAGFNPLAVDIVGTRLMGFNFQKLKWVVNLLENRDFSFYIDDIRDIEIVSNIAEFQNMFHTSDKLLGFRPHPGWQGYVELVAGPESTAKR